MSMFRALKIGRVLPGVAIAATLAVAAQFALLPSTAYAAGTTYTVTTTADTAASSGACGNTGITTPPSPLSLREATCLANNVGGAVTINLPAGTYNLTAGELAPGIASGSNVALVGAGPASTIVNAGGLSRVFNLDKNIVGGITNSFSGITITGGADSTFGGAGIIGGSNYSATGDSLTLTNVVVTGNVANGAAPNVTNKPGGGVQFFGGQLTITNSTFSNNSSGSSYGSGLAYGANGSASSEGLSITNATFSGNSVTNSHGDTGTSTGGALALFGTTGSNFVVADSRFVNNTVTATSGSGPAVGAAIWQQSGNLTVTGSTFTGNSVSGGSSLDVGGAIEATSGTTALHYNRFTGNSAPSGSALHTGATTDAAYNWWGCNAGPGSAGCDTVSGAAALSPRLVLTATATPVTVVGPNATSTISASLLTDSAGGAVSASNLGAFAGQPVTFSDPPGDATVTTAPGAHSAVFSAGVASIDYHSGATTTGPDPVTATFDNATVSTTVTVNQAPAITSPNSVNFTVGQAVSFTVTTTGYPKPATTESGTLPAGLTFTDNGDGSATFAGTPTGPGGTFAVTLTASNGTSPNATQAFTMTVGQSPVFTSSSTATFRAGSAGSFTVTTSGLPTVTTITESGSLPAGLTFTDNGNGTATLAGTPSAGTGGTYPVTLGATNGVSPNGSQTLTIQVNQAPAITANPADQTVNPGTSTGFIAAASGVPAPTVQWQRSTNGGVSYANIAGATSTTYTFTATSTDDGNMYRAVFTNLVSSATTTAATLLVGTAPAFTSANTTTFSAGAAGNFGVTTSGSPTATLSRSGAQFPAWLTLTDNGDGTGSLAGTPPAGSGGTYSFTLRAANGFTPSASQTFTLTVDQSPTITSADHATFSVGSAGAFTVTTTGGFPTSTALTETGALPSGVTFVDSGDGTAALSGTPAAGTAGTYDVTVHAAATGGTTAPAVQSFRLTVTGSPQITSTDHATFATGQAGSFTITTSPGFPVATQLTEQGSLPAGLTFADQGDGTATIAGTPAFNTGGVYTLTLTAANGAAADATQTFTLTVTQPPTITSADHATFSSGAAADFTVTTAAGQPSATVITTTGTLPAGVTFTDNGDGTADVAGTPTADGVFPVTITASNGVAPDSVQSFTLTVNAAPAITSADHTTFAVGAAGSFAVTTTPGTPTATAIAAAGALPGGISFVDNGDGTASVAGTPATGSGGSYPLTLTASNGPVSSTTQSFTLTITELPAVTTPSTEAFTVGTARTFTIGTTAGFPSATALTETGTLPAGVAFADAGDGSATLSGTPAAGTGGTYPLTITATNSAGHTDQAFTLVVNESGTITSDDHVTFTAGSAGSFTVTTAGGHPTPPTLTATGSLPSGVTFVDNGDGTAILSGTPDAPGTYSLTITESNGAAADTVQNLVLTVVGPPRITSDPTAAFTAGVRGSFTVTTDAGLPSTPTILTVGGAVPGGLTFTDNGDGTGTLSGTTSVAPGTYPLTVTASNGVNPDAVQSLAVQVTPPRASILPQVLPTSTGTLHGAPARATVGQTLHLSGGGFAAGAPITIGIYSVPVVLGHATAEADGTFVATIQVPKLLGHHTFIAAGIRTDGTTGYLEAASTIAAAPQPGAGGGDGAGGGAGGGAGAGAAPGGPLASTGQDAPSWLAGPTLGLILIGLALIMIARRRKDARN